HEPLRTQTPEPVEQEETTHIVESEQTSGTTIPDPQEPEDIIESEEFEESEMTEPGNVTGGGGTQSGTGPTGTAPAPPGDRQPGGTGGTGPRDRETDSPDSARIRSSILPGGKEAKVKPPPTFTGDRDAAEGFLKAVKLNLRMNKQMYNTNERKILYTLSHMEGGTAETWKNNALDDIFDEEKDDEEITFETFEKRFRERFEPFDKVAMAQRKLETLRMKRDEGGADEYVNKFRELANRTKFDDAALIVYFRRGLPENLTRRVMGHTPRPETIDNWMDLAKLHNGIYQETTHAINRDREIVNRQQNLRRNIAKNVGKIELQINRLNESERQDYMRKGLCFYCSKTGHRVRDCPL
ncbi:hypothetical protein MPER_12934, partial [Moniliophthora perniciosa FA553]